MSKFWALDIETRPLGDNIPEKNAYALEPWSCGERSEISSVAICDGTKTVTITDMTKMPRVLSDLKGKTVWAANAVFDVAYLLKAFGRDAVKDINWADCQLLGRFLLNGDDHRNDSYSLVECAKKWAKDWPHLEDFIAMKAGEHTPGFDAQYWLERGDMDATVTHHIAMNQMKLLPKEQIKGFKWMQKAIVPLAEALVQGILVDYNQVDMLEKELTVQMDEYLKVLGVSAKVVNSPKQLGNLLFNEWGLKAETTSEKTGLPSTSADDLKLIHYKSKDERLTTLLKYKTLSTIHSKYVKGFKEAREYLGRDTIHGFPRIFATATGRMSFSSNLLKKYQTSIALHQIPSRKKEAKGVKRAMIAPPGYGFVCFDVSAQELKFMAQMSKDPVMLKCFNEGLDLHSKLASEMFGVPYADLVEANKNGEPHHLVKYRSGAKRVNLSSQYRIQGRSLSEKFFSQDDEVIDEATCKSYLNTYKRTYEGIPRYWRSAINFAQSHKYTEALGGLRYYTLARNWQGESSAINHPIQGSAAMMSYYTIAKVFEKFPEFILQLQVHDSLMYIVKASDEEELRDWALKLERYLNTEINYREIFDVELVVNLTCDVSFGYSYGGLKHV